MLQTTNKVEPMHNINDKPKFKSFKKKFSTECVVLPEIKKKPKLKKSDRLIFGLIREELGNDVPSYIPSQSKECPSERKHIGRRKKKDSCFNTGRWHQDEHQRFIEALLKYGNDWKNVQKFVGSRSSTQARSHAQKFFVKIGKTQIENLSLDFENNSLKSLNILASKLNNDQLSRAIKNLNELAFDRKNSGRKNSRNDSFSFSKPLSMTMSTCSGGMSNSNDTVSLGQHLYETLRYCPTTPDIGSRSSYLLKK